MNNEEDRNTEIAVRTEESLWDTDEAWFQIGLKVIDGKPSLTMLDHQLPEGFPYYNFDKKTQDADYEQRLARREKLLDATSKLRRFLHDQLLKFKSEYDKN